MTNDPCPGCGKNESACPQYGDECWRNNGCPQSPPDRMPAVVVERPDFYSELARRQGVDRKTAKLGWIREWYSETDTGTSRAEQAERARIQGEWAKETASLILSPESFQKVVDLINNPPAPSQALVDAAARQGWRRPHPMHYAGVEPGGCLCPDCRKSNHGQA